MTEVATKIEGSKVPTATQGPKKKKTRKVTKYLTFQPLPEVKGGLVKMADCPESSRMVDIDKYLKANADKILDDFGTDEVQIAVFLAPVVKTIKRETKVTVS